MAICNAKPCEVELSLLPRSCFIRKKDEMEQNKINSTCISCGNELKNSNSKGVRNTWFNNGELPWCIDCQSKRVQESIRLIGNKRLAFYTSCSCFDTPYHKDIVDKSQNWIEYLNNLKENKLNKNEDGGYFSFADGKTDAMETIWDMDIKKPQKVIDMEEAKSRWGSRYSEDGVAIDYTPKEIEELDNLYNKQASEFKGAITPRVEMSLREICINRLEWQRCVGMGDSQSAKRYADMIKDAMAREGMRAGDQKPLENTRIDSLIVNLENMGAVKDGKIIGKDELIKVLSNNKGKYGTSLDVVDEMMLAIINTMRNNNGEPTIESLPIEAQINDMFGELLTEQTEYEKEAQSELGIIPPVRELR